MGVVRVSFLMISMHKTLLSIDVTDDLTCLFQAVL